MKKTKALKTKVLSLVEKWKRLLRVEGWDVKITFVELPDAEFTMRWNRTLSDISHQRAHFKFNLANAKKFDLDELIFHEMMHMRLAGFEALNSALMDAHTAYAKVLYERWAINIEETVCDNLDSTLSQKFKRKGE